MKLSTEQIKRIEDQGWALAEYEAESSAARTRPTESPNYADVRFAGRRH